IVTIMGKKKILNGDALRLDFKGHLAVRRPSHYRSPGSAAHHRPIAGGVARSEVRYHRLHIEVVRPRVRFPRRPHFTQHIVFSHRSHPPSVTPRAYKSAAARIPPPDTRPRSAAASSHWQ